MMAGNPNWWSMNDMHPQSHQHHHLFPNSTTTAAHHQYSTPPPPPVPHEYNHLYAGSSSLSSNSLAVHPNHDFPRSWSQLLLGGLANGDNERFVASHFQNKKLENWEDQILNPSLRVGVGQDVKEEVAQTILLYGAVEDEFQVSRPPSWSHAVPASSPTSCVTSLSSNLLNFSGRKTQGRINPHQENSSECHSSTTGSVHKKPRIQHSSAQPALKVRKEKLGERITALHQLVSPFGKTDTASVLSEAIGYIRFLQAQIEALSSPYLGNVSGGSMGQSHQQESGVQDRPKDLRSRGLCLVPISCTQHVGNETGADYWAPAAFGGGF